MFSPLLRYIKYDYLLEYLFSNKCNKRSHYIYYTKTELHNYADMILFCIKGIECKNMYEDAV